MKKLAVLVMALMVIGKLGIGATDPNSVKSLKPENKKTLKQMVLMNGHIERECDQKDPDACLTSSVNKSDLTSKTEAPSEEKKTIEQGAESKDERSKVIQALAADCKAGKSSSCKRLAVISKEMNKPRTSIQLFKMACENGDALICRELGEKLDKAGKKDLAALYMEKACRHGDQKSCAAENKDSAKQ